MSMLVSTQGQQLGVRVPAKTLKGGTVKGRAELQVGSSVCWH
jgi:hypothetical protein